MIINYNKIRNIYLYPLIVGGAVFCAAIFGIYTRPTGLLAAFWPANAILLGIMLRYTHLATKASWCAAVMAYLAADLWAGDSLFKTSFLTFGNMVGIGVGYILFSRTERDIVFLRHPLSIVYFVLILAAASVAAGLVGAVANPVLFNGSSAVGFSFWFTTELVNYTAILPVVLTLPAFTMASFSWANFKRSLVQGFKWLPASLFVVSIVAGTMTGKIVGLTYPVPALLYCALSYGLFTTTLYSLAFGIWALLAVSLGHIPLASVEGGMSELVLLRLGVMLIAIAPITVASVMYGCNALLKVASEARRAAEEAMATRSLLLATMTHELRTPLNAVIGFSDAMSTGIFGPMGHKKYTEYATTINDAGKLLLSLVNDLLEIAKVESGETKLEMIAVSSGDVVEQSARLVHGMAKERGIVIKVQETPWPDVVADPRAVKQVMLNLLSNATKFSPQNGHVHVSSVVRGDRLVISVQDFGQGISADVLPNIGRPFVQMGDVENRRQGTGLGLSLSRRFIELHGGEMSIDSVLGTGTVVSFDLPLAIDT